MSPGNKIDSFIFDFSENWLLVGGQRIGLAQRQCSINVFFLIKMKNVSSLVALIRGDFNQNEISDMPVYLITALPKILQWIHNHFQTPYKDPLYVLSFPHFTTLP